MEDKKEIMELMGLIALIIWMVVMSIFVVNLKNHQGFATESDEPILYLCGTEFISNRESAVFATISMEGISCKKGTTIYEVPILRKEKKR